MADKTKKGSPATQTLKHIRIGFLHSRGNAVTHAGMTPVFQMPGQASASYRVQGGLQNRSPMQVCL